MSWRTGAARSGDALAHGRALPVNSLHPHPARGAGDALVIACGVVAAAHVGKLPTALPALRDEFALSLLQSGFLLSLVQAATMVLALSVGLVVDRTGLRKALGGGLLLLALASAAGAWGSSAAALMLGRAAEGLGFLLVTLSAPTLVRELVRPDQLKARLGVWGAFMPAGTALALVGGPWVMGVVGWRGWWALLAVVALLMAVWVVRRLGLADPPKPTPVHGSSGVGPLRETLGAAAPWWAAATFAAYSSQWLTVVGFLPSIYTQQGLGAAAAGALTAGVAAANVVGNVAAGRLLQRGVWAPVLLVVGFVTMAVCAYGAFSSQVLPAGWARYAAVITFSAVGGLIPATLFATAVQVAPSERAVPLVLGWIMQWSALGQFMGPPVAAWWTQARGDWSGTWMTTGAAACLGIGLSLGLARHLRRP